MDWIVAERRRDDHVPRVEDWRVMPLASLGIHLKPDGFVEHNPALDLPPPEKV
jgi:primary-amine oxidase